MIQTQQQQRRQQQRQLQQPQQQQQQQQRQHQQLQQPQLLWTLSTASPLIFSPPAVHASAPSCVTGPLLMTYAHLVWTSPTMLPSSCTTSIVPRAGSTLQHHQRVSRVMIKENPGNML